MNATNDFEKYFFKLMINPLYGKAIKNLRKRISVRLVNNAEDFLKYTSRPTYIACNIVSEIMQLFMKLNPF